MSHARTRAVFSMVALWWCVLFSITVLDCRARAPADRRPPSIPPRYYVSFDFRLPQWKSNGYLPVVEPVEIWYDEVSGAEKVSMYGGEDVNILRRNEFDVMEGFVVFPRVNRSVCQYSLEDTIFGLYSAFPEDLSSYRYGGVAPCPGGGGDECHAWTRSISHSTGAMDNYTFYSSSSSSSSSSNGTVPRAFEYVGDSGTLLGYQHSPNYDWFSVIYREYKPGYRNESVFAKPDNCTVFKSSSTTTRYSRGFPTIPALKWISGGGGGVAVPRPPPTTGFNLGQFVQRRSAAPHEAFYVPKSPSPKALPASVNWTARGAVTPVKDQGDCGSCWSFGSTGAAEGAQFVAHAELFPLSEQYLMDCSWPMGNAACWGGDHASAYQFVLDHRGTWPTEAEYTTYRMNEAYCASNASTSALKLVGYKYVVGEHALMDALANHGPVAVAISTLPPTPFAFYHSGVYRNDLCNPVIPDHIVTAVGYGTTAKGEDYWILKNQWSEYWGEKGYMRIARGDDDCGTSTYGVLPIVA